MVVISIINIQYCGNIKYCRKLTTFVRHSCVLSWTRVLDIIYGIQNTADGDQIGTTWQQTGNSQHTFPSDIFLHLFNKIYNFKAKPVCW